MTGEVDKLAVLEAMFPDKKEQLREAFGLSASDPSTQRGYVYITEEERAEKAPALIEFAESYCPKWSRPDFSAKAWKRGAIAGINALIPQGFSMMREAISQSSLMFLMRKGVQTLANDWYTVTPRDWQDYALAASSNNFGEYYAPLYPSTIAGFVPDGDRFPEGQVAGQDIIILNRVLGLIEAFQRTLFDDDQTSQIRQRSARLGQSVAISESAFAALRFIGAAATYFNLKVSASAYTTQRVDGTQTSSPWDATMYATSAPTYGNRPTTYVQLGLNPLKQGYSNMLNARTPEGSKLVITVNTLLHSAMDALHAPLLVKPPSGVPYYPAIPGPTGSTAGTVASGGVGGYFGANPFMGLGISPVLVRYLPDWSWALMEKAKGFVFQERDPLEVTQEVPQSGQSFEMDAIRFRSRRRIGADWVDSRFAWLGNDGSITGSF